MYQKDKNHYLHLNYYFLLTVHTSEFDDVSEYLNLGSVFFLAEIKASFAIEGPPIQISRLSAILSHRQKLSILLVKSRLLHFLVEVFEVKSLRQLELDGFFDKLIRLLFRRKVRANFLGLGEGF